MRQIAKESANQVVEKVLKGNMVIIVLLNGKNSYRIFENREKTIIVPETELNDTDAAEAISEEGNVLTIEETVVGTPAYILDDEIISTLERKFETFSESIESRLLNIEEQMIGSKDSHIEKIGDDDSDNAFCFNLLKNHLSELERQIIEKDAIIRFFYLINSLIKTSMVILVLIKPLMTIKTVLKRELIILLIITSLWSNIIVIIKKKKVKTSS